MKKGIALLMAGVMTVSVAGCGSSGSGTASQTTAAAAKTEETKAAEESEAAPPAASGDEKFEFSLSMTYDVKSPMAVAAQKFCDNVKEASDGEN